MTPEMGRQERVARAMSRDKHAEFMAEQLALLIAVRTSRIITLLCLGLGMLILSIGAVVEGEMLMVATATTLLGAVCSIAAIVGNRRLRRDPINQLQKSRPNPKGFPTSSVAGRMVFAGACLMGITVASILFAETPALSISLAVALVAMGAGAPATANQFARSKEQVQKLLAEDPEVREVLADTRPQWLYN